MAYKWDLNKTVTKGKKKNLVQHLAQNKHKLLTFIIINLTIYHCVFKILCSEIRLLEFISQHYHLHFLEITAWSW